MGALPYTGGVAFRVWAPFASAVSVAGTFNAWNKGATPLTHEGGGYWSCDVTGAAIGDEYKFVVDNPGAGGQRWKNDPYARSLTNSIGNSIVAETSFTFTAGGYATPPWNEMVIYELHVGSFRFDPASANGRGNFDTVIGQLDYLRDLGINTIQLMPSDEFAGDISWGYNPSYIFAIESSYGGPNGLRRLVDAAHARGIAVIYDVVYNHLGPDDLDLWQFDGWSQDGHGGIYFYNDWRRVTPWGETRPDYGRGEVRQYLRDNALRWLEERRCDGLRWDATGWIRNVFGRNNDAGSDIAEGWNLMLWINTEIRQRQPWKLTGRCCDSLSGATRCSTTMPHLTAHSEGTSPRWLPKNRPRHRPRRNGCIAAMPTGGVRSMHHCAIHCGPCLPTRPSRASPRPARTWSETIGAPSGASRLENTRERGRKPSAASCG
jgi:1,4-alpha-glucan branching enzyme